MASEERAKRESGPPGGGRGRRDQVGRPIVGQAELGQGRRGARLKTIRRLGTRLPGLTRKSAERRPYHPGVHGPTSRARRTDYGRRLEEKQKVRLHYSVSERQLRRLFVDAARQPGATGATALTQLERRLDNVVFRLGLAPTCPSWSTRRPSSSSTPAERRERRRVIDVAGGRC